jgi:hypothetical protein
MSGGGGSFLNNPIIVLGGLLLLGGGVLMMIPEGREILRDIERTINRSMGGRQIPGIDIPPYTYKP